MPMGMPYVVSEWRKTGATRIGRGWFCRPVLEVEETRKHGRLSCGGPTKWSDHVESRWRKSRRSDFVLTLKESA